MGDDVKYATAGNTVARAATYITEAAGECELSTQRAAETAA